MLDAIPNTANIGKIIYTPKFAVICSIGKSPFHGEIKIEYEPDKLLLEFESFESWLFDISNDSMTIEDLCRLVYDVLKKLLGNVQLKVTVNALTTVHAAVTAIIET